MQTEYKHNTNINWNSLMNNATTMDILNVFMPLLLTLFQLINCNHFMHFSLFYTILALRTVLLFELYVHDYNFVLYELLHFIKYVQNIIFYILQSCVFVCVDNFTHTLENNWSLILFFVVFAPLSYFLFYF